MEIRKQKKNYLAWRRIGTRWEDLGIVGTIRHDEKKKLFGLEVHHLVLNIFIFPNKKYIYIYIYIIKRKVSIFRYYWRVLRAMLQVMLNFFKCKINMTTIFFKKNYETKNFK